MNHARQIVCLIALALACVSSGAAAQQFQPKQIQVNGPGVIGNSGSGNGPGTILPLGWAINGIPMVLGGGPYSITAAAASIAPGTTTITGGTTGRLEYNNSGVLGELPLSSGNATALGNPLNGANGLAGLDGSGHLPAAQMPAFTGDVTSTAGSLSTTVSKIQGQTVSGTTGTGDVVFNTGANFGGGVTLGQGAFTSSGNSLAIGSGSPLAAATVDHCLAIGARALHAFTTGAGGLCGNTAVGESTLENVTTGAENTALGQFAGANLTTASGDTFIGQAAGQQATSVTNSTAVGWGALSGCPTGSCASTATGSFNTAIGYLTMASATSANSDVAVGQDALFNLTTGAGDVAVGYTAGEALIAQNDVVILGNYDGTGAVNSTVYIADGAGSITSKATASEFTPIGFLHLPGNYISSTETSIATTYGIYMDAGNTIMNVPTGGTLSYRINNSAIFNIVASPGAASKYVCVDSSNNLVIQSGAC